MLFFGMAMAFWFLWIPVALITIWLVEEEHFWYTGSLVILASVATYFLWDINVLSSIIASPFESLMYAAIYLVAGMAWSSLWKWPRYCKWIVKNSSEQLKREIAHYKKKHGDDFDMAKVMSNSEFSLSPKAHYHRLGGWTIYWPISFSWALISKPVKYIWEFIFKFMKGVYAKVAYSAIEKAIDIDAIDPEKPGLVDRFR